MSKLHPASFQVLIACAAVALGCGGKVVFVEDDGTTSGQQGGAPSNGGAPPQVTGGAGDGGSTSVVGTPASPCQIACITVFQCGLQPDSNGMVLCPGFEPADQTQFVSGCHDNCEENMALVSVVDPDDCEGTIETLETVAPDFENLCKFGF